MCGTVRSDTNRHRRVWLGVERLEMRAMPSRAGLVHPLAAHLHHQLTANQTTAVTNVQNTTLAHQQSGTLESFVLSFRARIDGVQPDTAAYEFGLRSLNIVEGEREEWNNTWRHLGVPGANAATLYGTLARLQAQFIVQNAAIMQNGMM